MQHQGIGISPEHYVLQRDKINAQLRVGMAELEVANAEQILPACRRHIELLSNWNRSYNLTAVRNPEAMVTKHVLDSLSIARFVQGPKVVDIGTGAGFPGVPLALSRPDLQVCLLDANLKKIRFVRHLIAELALKNVTAVHRRAEHYETSERFDSVVARALGSLKALVELGMPLLRSNGIILAMKGRYPAEEISEIGKDFSVTVHKTAIPGLEAQRTLVTVQRKTNTEDKD